ncbi:MAG: hypothetical protein IT429_25310 [Gemmataceae bacterium]|nr:hypothetical protein [Gemmataceae bacterium]
MPQGKSPGQRISFLGSVAEGGRFCIIADRSASMRGNALELVKFELVRTLRSIGPVHQFFTIFFNTQAFPQPGLRWLPGGTGVPAVLPWIANIRGDGNTNPAPALELAFQLQPRPDAIFFMTDGQFDPRVADRVAFLNRQGPRIPINTILFIHENPSRPPGPAQAMRDVQQIRLAGALLQRIAVQSGGSFRAVVAPPNFPGRPGLR